jgi:hypothetical protein
MMADDVFTTENFHGFDAESLRVLNEAFRVLRTEYEGRFLPGHIHRIMLTVWTGKTTDQKLLSRTRYELALA